MSISRTPPTASSQMPNARIHSKVRAVRENVSARSILSKMIPDRGPASSMYGTGQGSGGHGQLDATGLSNLSYLQEISDSTSQNIEDAHNLYQLLPEIEMGTQILISLVLSPRDFVSTEINYTFPQNILPLEMVSAMLAEIEECFGENGYNIKAKLPDILRKAMFEEGSYPIAIIPENAIDDVINGRSKVVTESLKEIGKSSYMQTLCKPLGFLGSNRAKDIGARRTTGAMTLESLLGGLAVDPTPVKFDETVNCGKFGSMKGFVAPMVYDNPTLLKLPKLVESVQRSRMGVALENMGSSVHQLYHEPQYREAPMITMPRRNEASRETIGDGLVLRLPPESIILCHAPGEPENPMGGFVLLDQFGNPIDRATQSDYYKSLSGNLTSEASKLSTMLDNANQTEPDKGANSAINSQQSVLAFAQTVEKDLQTRFINGGVGANVTIAKQMMAYRIMLARSLASMQTRILYLPQDLLVYWAYDYNDNGTGRSFLENNKTLTAARGLLFFANLNAHLRNSIDHRTLDITSDPNDPHPAKTREMIVSEWARNKGNSLPWAAGNPKRMMEYIQLSGTNVTMTGVDGYPETKLEIVDRDITQSIIDMTYDDELKKRQLMSFGVAPELYDMTTNIEFSSKMVTSNALSTKRAILLQDKTVVHMRDFMMKFCLNSKTRMDRLALIVGKYAEHLSQDLKEKGELYIVLLFLSKFQVGLPKPDVGIQQQLEDYNEYSDAVDKILEHQLSEDSYTETIVGTSSAEAIKQFKSMTKATLMRAWCKSNNFMPDVMGMFDITGNDSDGAKMAEESIRVAKIVSHLTKSVGMQMAAVSLINENQWTHIKGEIEKLKLPDAPDPENGGGGSDYNEGGGDEWGDDGGQGDLFGGDDDMFSTTDEPVVEPGEDPAEPDADANANNGDDNASGFEQAPAP